jgi:hypothetical protein
MERDEDWSFNVNDKMYFFKGYTSFTWVKILRKVVDNETKRSNS